MSRVPGHPTTKRFQALWEQCGFHRAGAAAEEDRRPTRAGHRLDSFLLNSPLVLWAVCERSHLAPGRSPASLGSDHGPVVLDISSWRWPTKTRSPGWPTRTPKAGCMP